MSDTPTHPHERKVYYPSQQAVQSARISGMDAYRALCDEAEADYTGFWARLAREHLHWQQPFTHVLDDSQAPFYKWFDDGRMNV
ncbi:MAG: acetyl-coenzyme A synthetase N-terminal domain-containing protein, partial [Thiomonas sp.]